LLKFAGGDVAVLPAVRRTTMNANVDQSWRRQGLLYPTMLIAAIAVIIFSVIGIAAMTGLLPSAVSGYRAADDTPQPAVKRLPQDNPRVLDAPRAARSEPAVRAGAACTECGVVESVRTIERKGERSMAGTSADALVGGLLRNQEVSGGGRTAATVAGAGGFAGSETERNMNTRITYQVRVRMNDGSHRNHYQAAPPQVGVGQHVRLSNGHLLDD
jgi:outer membrane lipoprotein SlyB